MYFGPADAFSVRSSGGKDTQADADVAGAADAVGVLPGESEKCRLVKR